MFNVSCLMYNARRDAQCGSDGRQNRDGRLNHEFPKFFLFHSGLVLRGERGEVRGGEVRASHLSPLKAYGFLRILNISDLLLVLDEGMIGLDEVIGLGAAGGGHHTPDTE